MIDTHAHLDQFEDIEAVLKNAREAGITSIVAMSMDVASCKKNLAIKSKSVNPKIFVAFGIHPAEAKLENLEECCSLIREHKNELAAVGEIGLDYWYKWVRKDEEKKNEQRKVFSTLLNTAREVNLPVVIHSRGAWADCLQLAQESKVPCANFHWYSGPVDVLKRILDAGYFISISPSVAHSPQVQEAINYAPIDRILIETDSPVYFKNPENNEGFQAEPRDVLRTLKAYCRLKNVDEMQAASTFNQNADTFFRLSST